MPSASYRRAVAEATAHHASSKTYSGKFLRPHKPFLTDLVKRLEVSSILDYGCGKGMQYEWVDPADGLTLEQAWGCEVFKYDPAWPPFAADPSGTFDLVLCTHVMGSIPLADLDWVFKRIFGFATKAVYFAEKLGPIKKTALSAPDERPVGWSAEQWLEAVTPYAAEFAGETHFSFRYRDADIGVYVDRYVKPHRQGWLGTSNRPING